MNRKRTILIILILFTGLFPLIPIPIAKATEATVSIQESEDDVWMTESGNIFGYEASVRILEPEIGIRSFLRFEDVPLLKSSKINLATLNVYAGWDQGETNSPGAMVTIYGIDEPDCAPFSYSGRVWSLERPYTSAYVNWNVSYWPQSTWQAVNVTSIVRELINQYAWVQNNSIGFQILGASDSGYEYRTFEDIDHQHHGAHAYLYIQYDVSPGTPPDLPDNAEFVETYDEFDIWVVPPEQIEIGYTNMTRMGSSAKIHVFSDTLFNWTEINKNTPNVALGYLVNLTGPNSINSMDETFNFSVTVISHDEAQQSPIDFMMCGELPLLGTLNQIISGNELAVMELYTVSTAYYRFMARHYGTSPVYGDYSANLAENNWYMGRVILDGTLWRFEIRDMSGVMVTFAEVTLPFSHDLEAIHPMAGWGNPTAGSVVSGWMTKDAPAPVIDTYFVTDENGTLIQTWNGDNFTDINDLTDWIDDNLLNGGDPLDPDPGTQGWDTEGPFTRFNMRLYFLIIGLGCIFGPLWAMGYKKLDSVGYAWCALLMILGTGLLWSITGI